MIKHFPVSGLTISEAIQEAKKLAIKNKQIVQVFINDIDLIISDNTNVENCKKLYLYLLNRKYNKAVRSR